MSGRNGDGAIFSVVSGGHLKPRVCMEYLRDGYKGSVIDRHFSVGRSQCRDRWAHRWSY